jgi:hypothetical protein
MSKAFRILWLSISRAAILLLVAELLGNFASYVGRGAGIYARTQLIYWVVIGLCLVPVKLEASTFGQTIFFYSIGALAAAVGSLLYLLSTMGAKRARSGFALNETAP